MGPLNQDRKGDFSTTLSPFNALMGRTVGASIFSGLQSSTKSVLMASKTNLSYCFRSILLMAKMTCFIPSKDTIKECRFVCSVMPMVTSTRIMATSQRDAPVNIFLVYSKCPGVSAMMYLFF